MTGLKGFASFVLAASMVSALSAETHCPGNVESVPLHYVNSYQMVVAVSVNDSGPYDFLLDTGTQFTMVDPSLAAELHLSNQDSIPVDGTGFHAAASSAQLDHLAIGSQAVAHLQAVVYSLQNLKSLDLHLRGVLGEDFLQHFDMLIDNAHKMLCLDESSAMRRDMKGNHIALVTPLDGEDVPPNSLIIPIHLSGSSQPLRLKLDSGANAPFLNNVSKLTAIPQLRGASLHGSGTDGTQRAFVALPPQDMKIGSLEFSRVPFFALAGAAKEDRTSGFDGLLTMGLFRRVFICHAEHFAVLESR
jgi:predicted aspartyl protease